MQEGQKQMQETISDVAGGTGMAGGAGDRNCLQVGPVQLPQWWDQCSGDRKVAVDDRKVVGGTSYIK